MGGRGRQAIQDRSRFGDADHVPPGCLVGDAVADLEEMAEEYTQMWGEFGPTDHSVESIRGVDEMFAGQQDRANWLAIDLDDGRTGGFAPMAAQPACYFGEVMLRNYDAEWVLDPDYGWALGFADSTIVNLFGTVHHALEDEPPFVRMHDTFLANYDLDGQPLDPEGERMPERRQEAVDPDEFDDEEIERAAEQQRRTAGDMQSFAEDFVDNHPSYELDYSVASLSAADAVVAEQFHTAEFADAELGGTDDQASILLTAATTEAGAYFGEVVRRNTAAEWRHRDGDGLVLEVPHGAADVRVTPVGTARLVVEEGDSFAESYDEITETVRTIGDDLDGP